MRTSCNSSRDLAAIRERMLHMVHDSRASHIGSALSVVDILYVIYTRIVDINTGNMCSVDRDRVILSKGHASIAVYTVLNFIGIMPDEYLDNYYIDNGLLPAHMDRESFPAIDCSSGSLGHGLSIGIGMAMANPERKVFVIIGDGELNEGSVWEGLLFAGKKAIPNLHIIIDHNNLQAYAKAEDIVDYSRLTDSLRNFGLDACEINGHNISEIETSLTRNSPATKVTVAHTIKGKGVSYMENQLIWHYKSPNDAELLQAISELKS